MTGYLIAAAVGALVKTLLPYPAADDRVRAAWRWFHTWLDGKIKSGW